jgi:hypothetical protein
MSNGDVMEHSRPTQAEIANAVSRCLLAACAALAAAFFLLLVGACRSDVPGEPGAASTHPSAVPIAAAAGDRIKSTMTDRSDEPMPGARMTRA